MGARRGARQRDCPQPGVTVSGHNRRLWRRNKQSDMACQPATGDYFWHTGQKYVDR
jgi:hypothetical protein